MAVAIRQHANLPDAAEWVSVEDAARLTGLSGRTWRWRAQREAVDAQRRGRRSLAMLAGAPNGKGRPTWWVHRSLHPKLSAYPKRPTRDERTREALSAKHPAHIVDRALRKNEWLQRWRTACERDRGGATDGDLAARIVAEARQVEGKDFKASVRSLYGWWQRYNRLRPDGQIFGVEGLIDRYGGDSTDSPNRSPEAVAWFYDLYHTQNKLSVKVCHDVTLRESRRRGWAWPAGYTATVSWLEKHDDLSLTCLMRKGKDRWARKYLPHLQIDYGKIEPGFMYVCDHHELDLWCTYKGRQIRPWLTAVEDCRSRCIVGWHVGPAPHQDAILMSLRMAFRDWAIPTVMRIDNGRDYTSRLITGVSKRERDRLRQALGADYQRIMQRAEHQVECTDPRWLGLTGELGIELIYAIPYSPWSKMIERWFRTFTDQHARTCATYCGNSAVNKPECLHEIRRGYTDEQKRRLRRVHGKDWKRIVVLKFVDQSAVPSIEDVRKGIGEYLDVYHRSEHRGQAMEGRSPLTVWQTAAHLRKAVEDELLCLADIRGLYVVGGNGVSLKVGAATLHYGAKAAALKRWVGRRVLIALNPEDISVAWAMTPDRQRRKLIARLDPNEWIAPYTCADDAREAIAEKKREQSIMHKAQRSSARRTKTMTTRLQEHTRAKRAELLATGTDDAHPQPRIVPVHTGLEGVSRPGRSGFDATPYSPPDSGDLEDLFDDAPSVIPDDADDDGMEDLFSTDGDEQEPDEGLEGLL